MITLSLDVKKLDKTKFVPGKKGELYAKLVLLPRKEVGKFGDTHIVKQDLTKEERAQGVQMPIIGNATDRSKPVDKTGLAHDGGKVHTAPGGANEGNDEDVPF